jgi:hypothetical protein
MLNSELSTTSMLCTRYLALELWTLGCVFWIFLRLSMKETCPAISSQVKANYSWLFNNNNCYHGIKILREASFYKIQHDTSHTDDKLALPGSRQKLLYIRWSLFYCFYEVILDLYRGYLAALGGESSRSSRVPGSDSCVQPYQWAHCIKSFTLKWYFGPKVLE